MPNETENQLATKKVPLPIGPKGIQLESFEALWRFAQCIAASPFAPRGMEKAEAIVPAIQLGLEIGLSPMSALQNVAVINGRPGIYGDAALALVRASGRCESYTQTIEGEGDDRTATVISKRDDSPEPIVTTFGVRDAKRAGLWGKQGPWSQYPDRMLLFRARGFNLRDNFGDILKGMHTLEELRDLDIKPVQGREVASDIRFEEPEPEARSENVNIVDGQIVKAGSASAGTKAEMEALKNLSGGPVTEPASADSGGDEPSAQTPLPPRATPLEGLRNLINASPITEFQLEQRLIRKGELEPTRNLESLSDEKLLEIQSQFMTLAAEIVDAP